MKEHTVFASPGLWVERMGKSAEGRWWLVHHNKTTQGYVTKRALLTAHPVPALKEWVESVCDQPEAA